MVMLQMMPSHQRYLEILEKTYCVRDIMTLIEGAFTCAKSDFSATVFRKAKRRDYDTIPFMDSGRVAGYVPRKELESKMVEAITNSVKTLTSRQIVSADATFPELLGVIRDNGLAFVDSSGSIVGLVTLADFNKRPVRILLFGLIMELELQMLERIKSVCKFDEAKALLGSIASELERDYGLSKKAGVDTEWYECLDLLKIMRLFEESPKLRPFLGCVNSAQVREEFGFLVGLRNNVCHPENVLVTDAQELAGQWEKLVKAISALDSAKA
jgi:predicted transcriptional regulator